MTTSFKVTKTCFVCQKTLTVTEFAKKRNGLSSKCKPCQRAYNKVHYRKNAQKYIEKANQNRPKCEKEGCNIQPSFAVQGSKPRFCVNHKEEEAVYVNAKGKDITQVVALRSHINAVKRTKKKNEWFNNYRSKQQCMHCGEKNAEVFEFHHIDASTKLGNIGNMRGLAGSQKRLEEEIAKCIVLCRNCHTKVTQDDKNSFRSKFMKDQNIDSISHTNRRFIVDHLLKNPCVQCGFKDLRCLEFDHIDPTSKFRPISSLVFGKIEILKEELKKCQVLCGNCHRRKSNAESRLKRKVFLQKKENENANTNNLKRSNSGIRIGEEQAEKTICLKRRKIG